MEFCADKNIVKLFYGRQFLCDQKGQNVACNRQGKACFKLREWLEVQSTKAVSLNNLQPLQVS